MYAEQFNAPSWLEEPSRWLWWAFTSLQNRNLSDADYNLRQFWTVMDGFKASADTSTWPELLALDSVSHKYAADLTDAQINAISTDAANASAWMFGPVVNQIWDVKTNLSNLQAQRKSELQKSIDIANQANTAQSARVAAVANGELSQDDYLKANENKTLANILKPPSANIAGVPLWAWLVGGLALLYLVKR